MSAPSSPVLDRAADRAMYENRMRAAAYRAAAATPACDGPAADRTAVNRANAQHSTGPRTEAGKQRSSLNAIRHGLTAQTVVLPSEDPAAYQSHRLQFIEQYQPATPTESQLVQELIDTSWRLNRIPLLEADLLARAANPPSEQARAVNQELTFDIVDAHHLIAGLNIQGTRLSRQFQKALDKLREIQAERQDRERRDLKDTAALLELYKHKQQPWQPADHGFVFTKQQVERAAERMLRQNEARQIGYARFHLPPQMQPGYDKHTY